jgi:hypothetical protein
MLSSIIIIITIIIITITIILLRLCGELKIHTMFLGYIA